MAKKSAKSTRRKWRPHRDDAIKLGGLHWLGLRIEAEAIQIYATDAAKYEAIVGLMRNCVVAIHDLNKDIAVEDGDCPPGFVRCGGDCAPMCFEN